MTSHGSALSRTIATGAQGAAAAACGLALIGFLKSNVSALPIVWNVLIAGGAMAISFWAMSRHIVPAWRACEPGHRLWWVIAVALAAAWCSLVAPLRAQPLTLAAGVADCLSMAFGMAWLAAVLTRDRGARAWRPPGREWAWQWALCAAVWAVYLLTFWPATMSVDSVVQWAEMRTLHLDNWHPAAHTMTNWLITRVWNSPAAIAIVQVVGLSGCVAFALHELGWWGASRRARWAAALLIALSPVNGLLSVMLWKDIGYTIGFVFLTALMARLVRTRGQSAGRGSFLLGVIASSLPVALYRHNGPPIAYAVLALAAFVVPRQLRKRWAVMFAATLVGYVGIVQGINIGLKVAPLPPRFLYAVPLHQIAAVVAEDPPTDPETLAAIERIEPVAALRARYMCASSNTVFINAPVSDAALSAPGHPLAKLWWKLVPSHPRILWERQACITAMLWQIPSPLMYLTDLGIVANGSGLTQKPILPSVRRWLTTAVLPAFMSMPNRWWAWSPALYLYLALGLTALAAYRNRSRAVWVWMLPLLIHTALLFLINVAPDFRYQYAAYLLGLLSIAIASIDVRRIASAAPADAPSDGAAPVSEATAA